MWSGAVSPLGGVGRAPTGPTPPIDSTLSNRTHDALRKAAKELADLAENPWAGSGFAHQVHLLLNDLDTIERDIELEAARARVAHAEVKTVGEAVKDRIKGLREAAGWTQTEIAKAMVRLGFVTWKRITVAEAESGKRKLSIEEMIGYGILFNIKASALAIPRYFGALALNERMAITEEEAAMFLGGDLLSDAEDWLEDEMAGARVIGIGDESDDWRPYANPRRNR